VLLEAMEEDQDQAWQPLKLGIENSKAWEFANTRKEYWRIAASPILTSTFTNEYLGKLGFQSIAERYSCVH